MAAERLKDGLHARVYARTGMPVDGRYLAPQFRHHAWDRRGDVSRILSAKDYIVHALTGRPQPTPRRRPAMRLCAGDAGLGCRPLRPLGPAGGAAAGPVADHAVVGPLTADAAARFALPAGIPVHNGAADSAAGAFAMTGLNANSASIAMGSSAIIFGATPPAISIRNPAIC